MKITKETKLTQQSLLFTDGENGAFTQYYRLYADEIDTGIDIRVTGNVGKDNSKRIFVVADVEYEEVKEAFKAAGHEWQ